MQNFTFLKETKLKDDGLPSEAPENILTFLSSAAFLESFGRHLRPKMCNIKTAIHTMYCIWQWKTSDTTWPKYLFFIRWFLWSCIPVFFWDVWQNAVHTEVRFVRKDSPTVGTILGLVSGPVVAETGQTEAVSTWYGHWIGEDVSTQWAQKVLLGEEADGRSHFLEKIILVFLIKCNRKIFVLFLGTTMVQNNTLFFWFRSSIPDSCCIQKSRHESGSFVHVLIYYNNEAMFFLISSLLCVCLNHHNLHILLDLYLGNSHNPVHQDTSNSASCHSDNTTVDHLNIMNKNSAAVAAASLHPLDISDHFFGSFPSTCLISVDSSPTSPAAPYAHHLLHCHLWTSGTMDGPPASHTTPFCSRATVSISAPERTVFSGFTKTTKLVLKFSDFLSKNSWMSMPFSSINLLT